MLTVRLSRRYLWCVVSVCLMAGVLLWVCTGAGRATASATCRRQQAFGTLGRVCGALAAHDHCGRRGWGVGGLAPANSSMADAQDALDEAKKLAQQNKPQEATEQATRGLEECEKVDAMVAKARQDTVERKARAQLATEAEARIAQTAACVDGARQAVRSVSTTKTRNAEVAAAQGALDSAAAGLKQARELLAQNDPKGALGRLDTAQAECQTAQAASEKAAREASFVHWEVASEPVRPRCAVRHV